MDFQSYLGLARHPDSCLGDPPTDVVSTITSASGVFLDDVAELPLARLRGGDVWLNRERARAGAAQDLSADLNAFLAGGFPARKAFSGLLGRDECTQYLLPADGLVALPIHTHRQAGGSLVIRAVGLRLSAGVTGQTINLYRETEPTPFRTLTADIAPTSAVRHSVGEYWRLPMDGTKYELRAGLPANVRVADNKLACCQTARDLPGVVASCCSGRANGFMVDLYSQCNYDPLFSQLLENERTGLVLGYMLAYQAGYRLCVQSASGSVERATVLSESDLSDAARICRGEYLSRLNWLKTEVPNLGLSTDGACFSAARPYGWSRNGLIR